MSADWIDHIRIALYVAWGLMILLIVKLLIVRSRWRHPLRGNGPMLWALILVLVSVEAARAANIASGEPTPPPYVPSVVLSVIATGLIFVWLWQQMELLPAWLREHIRLKRKDNPPTPSTADYTTQEDIDHGASQG